METEEEYVMTGVICEDSQNMYHKVLARGSLEHCKSFYLSPEEEAPYEKFCIYTLEDFAEMASHVPKQ